MPRQPRVRVTSIEKSEPNIRLYVLALIELARELEHGASSPVELALPETEAGDER
jgi:hypothetical protein